MKKNWLIQNKPWPIKTKHLFFLKKGKKNLKKQKIKWSNERIAVFIFLSLFRVSKHNSMKKQKKTKIPHEFCTKRQNQNTKLSTQTLSKNLSLITNLTMKSPKKWYTNQIGAPKTNPKLTKSFNRLKFHTIKHG